MSHSSVRSRPWAFISNMFPSREDVSYGSFIQRSLEDFSAEGFHIRNIIVIRGRSVGLRRVAAYAKHYWQLTKLLLNPAIRHYYIHYASHHCLLPALGASCFGKEVIVNVHGDDLILGKSSFYRRAMSIGQQTLFRTAKLIIVPSPYFREVLLAISPDINSDRIFVSPSGGVDLKSLQEATAGRKAYWELSRDLSRVAEIGYVGRIDPDKGWNQLFKAFEHLPELYRSRCRLHFWGDGKDVNTLKTLITSMPDGQVIHHGSVAARDIGTAHAQFDFHVVPSQRESLGLAAIEGLGAGHILICSAIRPFTDITEDGASAIQFRGTDPAALTESLIKVLDLPDHELARIAINGKKLASTYDRYAVASALAERIDSAFN